ncbi:copper resistance CopC family protein [Microbacterium sp. Gd 4-13]|uniref:copper resistance CopC family protein n=1 Tax=Microbacterium sp. Gd 4-13 TaxID=2173179 RepID=UPI001F0BBB74|nr:copper resistance CopC family protein [Microbacterium sp. Gd 4-13]
MTSSPLRTRRRAPFAVAAALLALFAVFGPASPVSAHDQLVSTDPAADAVLTALPAEITLSFSAELLGDGASNVVEVTDAAGTSLIEGTAVVDGVTVTQALTGTASGAISVIWRVVSSDGHPISGEFAFTVDAPAPPTSAPTETTAPETTAPETPEPTMTTMTPPETDEPTTTTAPDSEASASNPLPWIIGVVVVLAVIGVVLYLLVLRPRGRNGGGSTGDRPTTDD